MFKTLMANELQIFRLAEYKELPLVRMMTPYWRLIAIAVVKDLHVRPQTVQLLSEMLGMSVDEFLVLTQAFTISYLALDKKHDILKRIALARGDGNKLWYDKENISSTVAFLFLQESLDIQAILDVLRQASDRFEHVTPTDLVEIELISTSCELLKTAGDLNDNNRSKVGAGVSAFRIRADFIQGPSSHCTICGSLCREQGPREEDQVHKHRWRVLREECAGSNHSVFRYD